MSENEERIQVPHNLDAEQAVVGAMLIDAQAIWKVMDVGLRPEHFYLAKHGVIMQSMIDLQRRDQQVEVDLLTVTDDLDRKGQLADVGGPVYLSELLETVPTALHVEAYARIVLGTSKRRAMLHLASEMAQGAVKEVERLDDVIQRTEAAIFELSQTGTLRRVLTLSQAVSEAYDEMSNSLHEDGTQTDVPIAYKDLADILGGWYRSDLYLIAARPGVGKTAMLLQIALDSAKAGKRVLLFSCEMASRQIANRMLANRGEIDGQAIRRRQLNDGQWDAFARASQELSQLPIHIDDTPHISPFQLRSKARQTSAAHGKVDLILADYIQIMSPGIRLESRNHEVGFIAKGLKSLAKEMDIPVIAASQLSRAVEQRQDKRPMLSDLRDSGELEQDADTVLFLYRDEIYNSETELRNIVDVIVAKHRHGRTGVASLFFKAHTGQFQDAMIYTKDLSNLTI